MVTLLHVVRATLQGGKGAFQRPTSINEVSPSLLLVSMAASYLTVTNLKTDICYMYSV